ncbi:MAG: bifunctional alpha/beta hydrolase/OsmC family protein [Candidatus Cyclobacteriaceae bacterium M2_1C_046]
MNSKTITFYNKEDQKLSGRLELPVEGKAEVFAIFAHCFTCGKNLTAANNLSRELSKKGVGVLRFDFTGLGESEGEFSETNFSSNIQDIISAADFLGDKFKAPQLLIGHSLGGAAVLRAAREIESVNAVVTIGAPADPPHVKKLLKENIEEINKKGKAEVNLGGRTFTIKKQFLDDLEKYELEECLKNINAAVLILHSPQDKIVNIENAKKIYKKALHPKSFISLDGADHLLSNKQDSLYVARLIDTWSDRYLNMPDERVDIKSEKRVLTRTGDDGYTTLVKTGQHKFLSDEPESVGGTDLGPTPYDLLVAALGTCTGMTLRMYADRKKWPLEEIRVHLQHDKLHAEDCDKCDEKNPKIDRIERIIEVIGDLDDKQRQRLLEIADKCPVHNTLHNKIEVVSKLK